MPKKTEGFDFLPKKKTHTPHYMNEIRASVQLLYKGLQIRVVIPWEKFARLGVDPEEVKKKYRKGKR